MDFATIRKKIQAHQYISIEGFEKDIELVVNNCMAYNSKDTIFYRAAVKLRDQVCIDCVRVHNLQETM